MSAMAERDPIQTAPEAEKKQPYQPPKVESVQLTQEAAEALT